MMDVEGININIQIINNTNNRVNDKECSIESSNEDATMTLQHGWNDNDIGNSQKDIHEIDNIEEDIRNYYVEDDKKDLNEELQSNAVRINILKRKAELGGDENFKGFDVEPYDVHEFKQFLKRIRNECLSTNHQQPINVHKKGDSNVIPEETINSNLSFCLEMKDTEKGVAILEENITNKKINEVEKDTNQKKNDNKSNHDAELILHAGQQLNKSSPTRNAIYRKPLQMGWKRELVHRANPSSSRDKGEAYYITPSGKKLRTKGEILQHLTPESGLTIENFTFTREALGFGPNEEIIRCAKLKSNNNDFVLINRKQSLDNSGNLGKRIPKPKVPKGASPPPHGWTPVKAIKAGSSLMSPRLIHQIKNSEDIENKSGLKSTQKISKQTKKNNQADSSKNVNCRNKVLSIDSISTKNQQQSTTLHRSLSENFSTNFFGNVSLGYDILLHTFQYLKVQELLRAACVCRMWNVVANHRSLWETVRMKNSQIKNWFGLSAILRRNETKHLDLRKMLISSTNGDEMWQSFLLNIKSVKSLEIIDLCKCSANIVEELFILELNLKILNAVAIKDDTLNLTNLHNLRNLEELRLKSIDGCNLESNLQSLKALKNLKHLSLTSFRELGTKEICYIGELTCLETLELGECTEFNEEFVDVLLKLQKLERLRLEKGQEPCCTLNILEGISKISTLTQLELVNFDVRTGFDDKLSQCKNLKKLLLIPTYVSQSATTNNIVLKALLNLSDTLRSLTWVVTLELLRVTALYVVQCDDKKKDNKVFDESIPVLKPVPSGLNDDYTNDKITAGTGTGQQKITSTSSSEVPQVEILPLTKVERILLLGMPDTKFKILKVPYHATWRQNYIEIQ